MGRSRWRIYIGIILIVSTVFLGGIHYLLFHDAKTELFYLALDVVFVPLQVLLVSIIIEKVLSERERAAMRSKMYMVIGSFYSEVGVRLLSRLREFPEDTSSLDRDMKITIDWKDDDFDKARKAFGGHRYEPVFDRRKLEELKELLISSRGFTLGLLQNPNLLEHDELTDLLWAVLHLTEELMARPVLSDLPKEDVEHLLNDMRRAFGLLGDEWIEYMRHLRTDYPYLYSLAARTNPFNPDVSVIIGQERK